MQSKRAPPVFVRFVVLWLAGIGLRVTVLAVPPLLPLIHRSLGLDEKAVGVLSGIPVLLLGIAALGGALVVSRIGARRAIIAGLMTIAVAGALRGVGPSLAMLFAMTFVMSAGIAIMQPALPTLVAQWVPSGGRIGATRAFGSSGCCRAASPHSTSGPMPRCRQSTPERSGRFARSRADSPG